MRVVRIGFTHFIAGRKVEMESWREGGGPNVTAWLGINEISQMYVYDDLDEARKAYDPDEL